MTHRTPWLQSSLLSDRVKPKNQVTNATKNKGKAKESAPQEPPKSSAVRALEATIKKMQSESGGGNDEKGGCFCLARTHELSPFCPICSRCGLILCSLNAPYHACPHCSAPLLSQIAKETLLDRLRMDLANIIAKEEEEAERAREEARQAVGAFPSLNSSNSVQQQQVQQPQSHKVLSLNSKTKRVTVASYTAVTPVPSPPARLETLEREASPERIPSFPEEPPIAREPPNPSRPWLDLRGDGLARTLTYAHDPRADREQLKESRKARKANKRKGGSETAERQDRTPDVVESSTNS